MHILSSTGRRGEDRGESTGTLSSRSSLLAPNFISTACRCNFMLIVVVVLAAVAPFVAAINEDDSKSCIYLPPPPPNCYSLSTPVLFFRLIGKLYTDKLPKC